jgi:ribosomal protein L35
VNQEAKGAIYQTFFKTLKRISITVSGQLIQKVPILSHIALNYQAQYCYHLAYERTWH